MGTRWLAKIAREDADVGRSAEIRAKSGVGAGERKKNAGECFLEVLRENVCG